jgi:parallel beta-helix repeat protein
LEGDTCSAFKRFFLLVFVSILFLSAICSMQIVIQSAASQTTIDVPKDYLTIQAAIDAASPGDTIIVSSGTYYELLNIDKSLTLQGEDRDTAIIDGNGTGTVVFVSANNVAISGFTIRNSSNYGCGIYLTGSNNVFGGNVFENCLTSIRLVFSSDNTVSGNIIRNSYDNGIYLWNSSSNVISENNVTESGAIDIEIRENSNDNIFERNILTNSETWGIYVRSCFNNIFDGNTIRNGQGGVVVLDYARNNIFSENTIENYSEYGIQIGSSNYNTFSKNTIRNNKLGIYLWGSSGNTFTKNIVESNTAGLDLSASNNNTLYHNNFISNPTQVTLYDSLNIWDNCVEGNYWSDYAGQDLDGDGVGDTNLPHQGVDYFPLMNPWGTVSLFKMAVMPLSTIPNIDGFWSANEWDDANEYNITGSGGTSYVRVKHDGDCIYIIIDSVWDTTNSCIYPYENTWIAFDTTHDQGATPQNGDYLFITSGMVAYVGDGTKWVPMLVPSGFEAQSSSSDEWGPGIQPSPKNFTPHRIDEFKMPLAHVGLLGGTVGFYIMVIDDSGDPDGTGPLASDIYVEWPTWAGGNPGGWPPTDPCPNPNAWGHLTLLGQQPPVATFLFSPFAPNRDDVVAFDASPSYDLDGTIANYTWNFGDGNVTTVTVPMITHVFSTDGIYAINLTVTDKDGLTDWIVHVVTVGAPVAVFSFSPSSPNPDEAVVFDASASYDPDGVIANYAWNFDDGNTTTVSTPIVFHVFSMSGSYDVNLTVTDNDGITDWIAYTVTVGTAPQIIAPFSTVTPFIDGVWNPGEWNDANEYVANGTELVSYVRVKHDGDYLYIIIDSPWDTVQDPMYGGPWGSEGVCVAFDTAHDHGTAPQIDDYLFFSQYSVFMNSWRGDGTQWVAMTTPTDYNAYQDFGISPHNTTSHRIDEYKIPLAYVGSGGFYVIARDDGSWNGTTFTAWVEWPIVAGGNPDGWPMPPDYSDPCPTPSAWGHLVLSGANISPVAAFTYSPFSPDPGDVVAFDASASYDSDGTIANYTWNFGDGNVTVSSTPVINHRFTSVGSYNVNLTVTDNDGLKQWVVHTIKVGEFARESIIVPLGGSAEADGYIKPGEYDDALKIDLSNATWEAYLYVKHDGEFLYFFIDHVSDTFHHPAGYDNGWVAIDVNSDGGNEPKEDDYLFHSSGHHVYLGDGLYQIPGSQWEELMGHGETPPDLAPKLEPFLEGRYAGSGPGAFGPSPNSLTPHSIFEIKFPITGWEIENKTSFGFCAAAGSPGTQGDFYAKVVWPDTAYDNYTADFYPGGVRTLDPLVTDPPVGAFPPPSTWGTLRLGKTYEENITAPLAKVIPTPDGLISAGEWDDAEVVAVGYPDSYGYLYVKHNYTFLWVLLDHVTDTEKSPLGWDNGWVAIDSDISGGSEPQEYDMLFHSHGHLVYIGDGMDPIEGSQWGILRGHFPEDTPEKYWPLRDLILTSYAGSGPGWGPTEASNTLHAFFELQIPLGVLELIPEVGDTTEFGFCASMQDNDAKTIIDWPKTCSTGDFWPGPDSPSGSYAPPDLWGLLTLSPESLTEKPPLPPPPERVHDLLVLVEVPDYLVPGTSTVINATVINHGSGGETNVEFQLLIDGQVVRSTTIISLQGNSSHTLSHPWTPFSGTYNITAYAVPVPGEDNTNNNRATKTVEVRYPLINPIEGQWANYTVDYYENGTLVFQEEMNIIYGQYVSPYLINVTMRWKHQDFNSTTWILVNTMNRQMIVEVAPTPITMWYYGWIETDITLGSTINLFFGTATVVGSQTIEVEGTLVDCWELVQEEYDSQITFWYDKASGLWIGYESGGYSYQTNITLVATNIPIGGFVHNIAITNVEASSKTAILGDAVIVTVDIENQGDFNETFVVTVFHNNDVVTPTQNVTNLMPKTSTTLTFIWNTTDATVGEYTIKAQASVVPGESYISDNTFIDGKITVLQVTIDVEVDVGSVHFRGELAEFYILVSVLGESVDADINAILYHNGTSYADLSQAVEYVANGLYRVPYAISTEAPTGTYALVVEASYLSLRGTSLKSFLLSPTLTGTLISLNGTVAWIKMEIGIIEGQITSIEGSIATVETDIGTVKTILEGWTGGTTSPISTPLGNFQMLVLTTSILEGPLSFSDNVLRVTLSGPSGTIGITNVVIPKQLLVGIESSIDKVIVTIDDEQVVFTYTEQPETYVLHITYTHSSHLMRVYLTGLPPIPFPAWVIAFLVFIVAVVTGVAFSVLKIRKRSIVSDSKNTQT